MESEKNTLLLSTAYLPPVEYFARLLKYSEVFIEQYETYPKQTFRNRCEIYSEKGRMSLSIPVTKVYGNHTQTGQIKINNTEKWQLNHLRAIEAAYTSSPYYLYYKDELQEYFIKEYDSLLNFNTAITNTLCRMAGIKTKLNFTDVFILQPEDALDLRNTIHPKKIPTLSVLPNYIQVFDNRHGFIPNLSIIDLIFNLGPETKRYLEKLI